MNCQLDLQLLFICGYRAILLSLNLLDSCGRYSLMSDLLQVHAFPRAVRPSDKGHAAAVSDVGVIRDETFNREFLVEFSWGGGHQAAMKTPENSQQRELIRVVQTLCVVQVKD